MKKFLVALLLSSSVLAPAQAESNAPAAAEDVLTAREVADKITAFAAGYCKGLADKHGVDFATCFKQATDYAIAQLQDGHAERNRD